MELLNVSRWVDLSMIESVPVCIGLDVEDLAAKPSRSELSQALNCLKNGKSPGDDGIQLEHL